MGFAGPRRQATAGFLIALLVVSVALAGCMQRDRGGAGEGLRLGSIMPLTGGLADFGPSSQNAVNLAVRHVNDAGGVRGADVQHFGEDSETDEGATTSAAANLIEVQRIHGLVGPMGSGPSLAIIEQVASAQIPMISPSNTGTVFTELSASSDTGGWYFRTVPSDALQGWVMAFLVQTEGMSTISILAQDTPYGVGFGDVVKEQFEARGGTVSTYIRYDPAADDFSGEVEDATTPEPDGVVVVGYPDEGETLVRNAIERDKIGGASDIRWFFSEGFKSQAFVDRIHQEAPGVLNGYNGTTPMSLTNETFLADYQAAYGEEPFLFADRTYDATVLLMLAAEFCNCTGGEAYKEAIVDVQNPPGTEVVYDVAEALRLVRDGTDIVWTGAAGPLEFDDNNDVAAPYATWAIVDGQITTVQTGIVPE